MNGIYKSADDIGRASHDASLSEAQRGAFRLQQEGMMRLASSLAIIAATMVDKPDPHPVPHLPAGHSYGWKDRLIGWLIRTLQSFQRPS